MSSASRARAFPRDALATTRLAARNPRSTGSRKARDRRLGRGARHRNDSRDRTAPRPPMTTVCPSATSRENALRRLLSSRTPTTRLGSGMYARWPVLGDDTKPAPAVLRRCLPYDTQSGRTKTNLLTSSSGSWTSKARRGERRFRSGEFLHSQRRAVRDEEEEVPKTRTKLGWHFEKCLLPKVLERTDDTATDRIGTERLHLGQRRPLDRENGEASGRH